MLVFTTVFPSPGFPLHGTFVLERTRHLASLADIRVVAPVPWYRSLSPQPSLTSELAPATVTHPQFWYIPRFMKAFDGVFLFLSAVREVSRLRRTFKFDLIDAHFAYPDGFAAVLLGRWFRCPVCITLRGTIIPLSRRPLIRWLCDWAIRHATRVIAVAENLAQRARQGGVPAERIKVIANGVDGERFRLIARKAAREQLGLSERGRLLVSVGHLSPRKGFHRVIRSLPKIVETFPDVRLAIVGGRGAEGDNSADLRALVSKLGLENQVLFVGEQTPDRVALWLGAANAFVLASDFEGCPNVILEAMACGRPIVATRVGDVERMVPAFAGILVDDPEDPVALGASLLAILNRDWDAHRIRDHVSARSWDDVARQVIVQWNLPIEEFGTEGADRSAASDEDSAISVARSPES
ncbi:MAG TPA: glycosyltransferase [Nitrospira sp.]|nr:glycosyltransferase [Nitrospira sp.]